jgi:indolepyruvate ferredoxin oxidoreductase alpha subunit
LSAIKLQQPQENTETLLGSEAAARGAYEAGARLATGYPGTPATPALEYLIRLHSTELRAEWAINEKVALEVAIGHSWAGQRSFVAVKMSGLNVASDSLLSLAASGSPGGLVILVGDDPGAYYGMVEQDSRLMARLAVLPMIEPATPVEARDFMKEAFRVSDETQAPVLVRQTTTTANSCAPIPLGEVERTRRQSTLPDDLDRYTKASSLSCRRQHAEALKRLYRAGDLFDRLNEFRQGECRLGIVAAGSVWTYVEECLGNLSGPRPNTLKVAVVNPLPDEKIRALISCSDRILVVEELEPVIEERVRALAQAKGVGVTILGKAERLLPPIGDLDPNRVAAAISILYERKPEPAAARPDLSPYATRTFTFCPGCPHRSAYAALQGAIRTLKLDPKDVLVTGDIGCTILGMNEPYSLCRTELVMGASIAMAQGFSYAGIDTPIVATIGDSTFLHSGLPALINASSRNVNLTVLVLDNGSAAMTGAQASATTTGTGRDTIPNPVSLAELAKAVRVRRVKSSTPYLTRRLTKMLVAAMQSKGVNVVISEAPCVVAKPPRNVIPFGVRAERCPGLSSCEPSCLAATACPAIECNEATGSARIDENKCIGCGLCAEVCRYKAIGRRVGLFRRTK